MLETCLRFEANEIFKITYYITNILKSIFLWGAMCQAFNFIMQLNFLNKLPLNDFNLLQWNAGGFFHEKKIQLLAIFKS